MPAWDDVRRRARSRLPRRRLVLATAICVAALAGGPALGVLLTRSAGPRLPQAADRSHVSVALDPRTGRVLLQVAPWRRHDGICYLFVGRSDGCSARSPRGGGFTFGPPGGYTFDPRVASVTGVLANGDRVRLELHRFGGRLDVTCFTAPPNVVGPARALVLRAADGRLIGRLPAVRAPRRAGGRSS